MKNKGFTVLELLIVIVMIGIVSVVIAQTIKDQNSSSENVFNKPRAKGTVTASKPASEATVSKCEKVSDVETGGIYKCSDGTVILVK